jgi:hypothetical protein
MYRVFAWLCLIKKPHIAISARCEGMNKHIAITRPVSRMGNSYGRKPGQIAILGIAANPPP